MKKVYALGVMLLDEKGGIKQSRLWSLYLNFEDAERAVLSNTGDIFEYYYNYALIEEIWVVNSEDNPTKEEVKELFPPKEWWYKATFYGDEVNEPPFNPKVEKTNKPQSLERVAFFWIG